MQRTADAIGPLAHCMDTDPTQHFSVCTAIEVRENPTTEQHRSDIDRVFDRAENRKSP